MGSYTILAATTVCITALLSHQELFFGMPCYHVNDSAAHIFCFILFFFPFYMSIHVSLIGVILHISMALVMY